MKHIVISKSLLDFINSPSKYHKSGSRDSTEVNGVILPAVTLKRSSAPHMACEATSIVVPVHKRRRKAWALVDVILKQTKKKEYKHQCQNVVTHK